MKKIILFFTILVPLLCFSQNAPYLGVQSEPLAVPINEFTNALVVAGLVFGAYIINKRK